MRPSFRPRLPRAVLLSALLPAALGSCAVDWPAALAAQTFRSAVELVPISAVVRDGRGRLVTSLTESDFEVVDKGDRRPILDFQIDRASPVAVALLMDVSGSMRMHPRQALAEQTAERILAGLRGGRDEAALFTFDLSLREVQPFTTDIVAIGPLVRGGQPFGTTSLYDAIAATARLVAERPWPRRAVIVLTDGLDTSSTLTGPEVSGLASSIDVPVYVVVTVPQLDRSQYEGRSGGVATLQGADLRDLAQWTGGDLLWTTAEAGAETSAQLLLTELRLQYLIAIESAPGREWRPLEVRVKDRRLSVRARSGYFGRTPLHDR